MSQQEKQKPQPLEAVNNAPDSLLKALKKDRLVPVFMYFPEHFVRMSETACAVPFYLTAFYVAVGMDEKGGAPSDPEHFSRISIWGYDGDAQVAFPLHRDCRCVPSMSEIRRLAEKLDPSWLQPRLRLPLSAFKGGRMPQDIVGHCMLQPACSYAGMRITDVWIEQTEVETFAISLVLHCWNRETREMRRFLAREYTEDLTPGWVMAQLESNAVRPLLVD